MIKWLYEQGYRVDDSGQAYNPKGRPIGRQQANGYCAVGTLFEGKSSYVLTHRLSMYQIVGDKIFDPNLVVCHVNDVKNDNRIENLRLGTRKDNFADAKRNGIKIGGQKKLDHKVIIESVIKYGFSHTLKNIDMSGYALRQIIKKHKKELDEQPFYKSQIPIPFSERQ